MKYLKLYEDKVNNQFGKELVKMKSLPYNEFMPKLIQTMNDPNFKTKLQSTIKSTDKIEDYGISKEKTLTAKSLIPTQVNIGLKESLSWMSEKGSINQIIVEGVASIFSKNRILTLNNKWIIEGHQKWAYVYLLNPNCEVPCVNINLPEQSPSSALKDIQIGLAATYGDIYTTPDSEMKYDLGKMEPEEIQKAIERIIPDSYVLLLQQAYAQTSFIKQIAKKVIPTSLKEAKSIKSSDYLDLLDEKKEDDKEIEELDQEKDEEGEKEMKEPGAKDKLQDMLSLGGWVDPTGTADILNGAIYIYSGNYLMGFLSIMSALPLADIACKGMMKILESVAAKQLTKLLAKALRKFDAKSAAKIWLKLEKKFPEIGPWLKTIVENLSVISQKIGKVAEIISKHWLKFRIVQVLFQTKIVNFFKEMFNFKISLQEWLDKVPEEKVYETISNNAKEIKNILVEKNIYKLNIPKNLAPHTLQTALKVGMDPKGKSFKGIPSKFLETLPTIASSIKDQESKMPKMKSFGEFSEKPKQVETPKSLEEKPQVKEKTPTKEKPVVSKPSKDTKEKPKEVSKKQLS